MKLQGPERTKQKVQERMRYEIVLEIVETCNGEIKVELKSGDIKIEDVVLAITLK